MATKTKQGADGVRDDATAGEPATEGGDEGAKGFELGAKERRFLVRVSRFLVGMQTPARVKAARREGYTSKEHELGWSLYAKAAGRGRSLEHYLEEIEASDDTPASAEQMRRLRELDAFENQWFPRTRALIRRVVPRDERDRFAEAFFRNLEQQPLGPGVVNSVATFLARVDELRSSKLKGAADLHKTFVSRGLTEGKVAQIRQLLEQVRASDVAAPSATDPRARLKAQREQGEAYDDLRDWFNDWATTLRQVLPTRDLIKLGLVTLNRAGKAVPDESEGDPAEGNDAGEDEVEES
jgi:hypothetical protein